MTKFSKFDYIQTFDQTSNTVEYSYIVSIQYPNMSDHTIGHKDIAEPTTWPVQEIQAQIKRIRHKDELVAYDVYCEGYRFTEQNFFGNRLFYANENLDAIFKIQEEMRTKSFKTPRIEQTESSIRNHPIIPMSNLKTSAPRGGSAPGIPRYGFNIKIAFRINT